MYAKQRGEDPGRSRAILIRDTQLRKQTGDEALNGALDVQTRSGKAVFPGLLRSSEGIVLSIRGHCLNFQSFMRRKRGNSRKFVGNWKLQRGKLDRLPPAAANRL